MVRGLYANLDRFFESTLRYLNDISKIGGHVLYSKDLHRKQKN